ncbi:MAG: hypothetical protein MK231_01830 [Pelagibacterales bacterium]|nr:hypothetical protein [Pelagibacterales bacterium]
MKKVLFILFLGLVFCNTGFAESYYFKKCKLSENASGDYLIDFDKNVIKVTLKTKDGISQELTDKIKLITKDQIVSDIIQNKTNKKYYLQYNLNVASKSIIRQRYIKKSKDAFLLPIGPKKQAYCANVKANWNMEEWDANKKEEAEAKKKQEESLQIESNLTECQGSDSRQWTNCKGTYTTENGYKYVGKFKDGKILIGTATYSGGARYVGEFKNDEPHGQGTFTYSDGSKYFGEWKDGKGHGQGIKTWKDGRKYTGGFKNDEPHGQGTFIYPDGSKYFGQYKDGKRHGEGTLTYSDGKTYIGQFVAGLAYGKGLCINQDGSSVECKMLKIEKGETSAGKNRRSITIEAKKWVKLSEYESASGKGKKIMDQLENNFSAKASELCSSTGNFNILEKRMEILEIDETPAFGIEPKIKIGINGVVECI